MNSNSVTAYQDEILFDGALNARRLAEDIFRQIEDSSQARVKEIIKMRDELLTSLPKSILKVKIADLTGSNLDIAQIVAQSKENTRVGENRHATPDKCGFLSKVNYKAPSNHGFFPGHTSFNQSKGNSLITGDRGLLTKQNSNRNFTPLKTMSSSSTFCNNNPLNKSGGSFKKIIRAKVWRKEHDQHSGQRREWKG